MRSDIYEQMKSENYLSNICQTIHENEFITMNLMQIVGLAGITVDYFSMFIHMQVDI